MIYWDRPTLKLRAKEVLRKTYWMSLLAMLLYTVVCNLLTGGHTAASGGRFDYSVDRYPLESAVAFYHAHEGWFRQLWQMVTAVLPLLFTAAAIGGLIGAAYTVFVANPVEIGKNRYFTLCRYNSVNLEEMLYGFKNGRYLSNVKTLFLRDLYAALWGLLFIIPGIVKRYSYWMMPYILAENPGLSTERAFEISMRTTQGEKWEIFVLELSFIGWYLLGALACGVGILFVQPYHEATRAELYGALRFKAISEGIADRSEIGAEL